MLGGMLWNRFTFTGLFWLIGCFSLTEFQGLAFRIDPLYQPSGIHRVLLLGAASGLILAATGDRFRFLHWGLNAWGMDLLIVCLLILPLADLFLGRFRLRSLAWSLGGWIYLCGSMSLLVGLGMNRSPGRLPLVPLGVISCIWVNDTMAYITGSLIGKHPFFPAVSPKKTWEGTLGGILFTLAGGALYSHYSHSFRVGDWILLAGLTAVAGTAGDLLESRFKRIASVKDSGRIFPGHGGFLDRFDSLFLAVPLVWAYIQLFL